MVIGLVEEYKLKLEERNGISLTPLQIACLHGERVIIQYLLKRGADIEARTENNWTPLHLAFSNGDQDVVNLLLDRGASIDAKTKDDLTALHLASFCGHQNVAKYLLDKGASINAKTTDKHTPLHMASSNGHQGVAELLLDRGASLDAQTKDKQTPLHLASFCGHQDVVKLLTGRGASIDLETEEEHTPLHLASTKGHLSVVKLLLDKGANINAKAKGNVTPLHLASCNGHGHVVILLLDGGIDIQAKTADNMTSLDLASSRGHWEIFYLLDLEQNEYKESLCPQFPSSLAGSDVPLKRLSFVVFGQTSAGRQSIVNQFVLKQFYFNLMPLVGCDFCSKDIFIREEKVKLKIYTLAGSKAFKSLFPSYYREADAALLTYDITSCATFDALNWWLSEIKSHSKNDKLVIMLVGNKSDVEAYRQVQREEGEAFALEHGLTFLETSAKTGTNIDKAFLRTARMAYAAKYHPRNLDTSQPVDSGCGQQEPPAGQNLPSTRFSRCCLS